MAFDRRGIRPRNALDSRSRVERGTHNSVARATALIEGLQWDNSIGPRKR